MASNTEHANMSHEPADTEKAVSPKDVGHASRYPFQASGDNNTFNNIADSLTSKNGQYDISSSFDDPKEPVCPEERRLLWRQDVRIVSFCSVMYFLLCIDRSNIGNAKILNISTGDDLQHTTGMSDYQFTIALMAFQVAYALFEVPSNILLKKMRPSRWLSFLMFSWGAVTVGLGAAHSFASVTTLRFVLGMFEAGMFPGLVFYLTFWYRHDERGTRYVWITKIRRGAHSPLLHG